MDFLGGMPSFLKNIAPTIATALGGPLAGMGVKALSEAVFGDAGRSPEEVMEAMGALTPAQIAAIKQADRDFKLELEKQKVKLSELEVSDRVSARQRQVEMNDKSLTWLGFFILAATVGMEGYVLFNGIPHDVSEVVTGRILGTFDMLSATVVAFFFGSSMGSRIKDMDKVAH